MINTKFILPIFIFLFSFSAFSQQKNQPNQKKIGENIIEIQNKLSSVESQIGSLQSNSQEITTVKNQIQELRSLTDNLSHQIEQGEEETISINTKLEEMQTKISLLEEQLEQSLEEQEELNNIAGWDKGFYIRSRDRKNELTIGGLIWTRYRGWIEDGDLENNDFSLPSIRITLNGKLFKYFEFSLMPDFGKGDASLRDAYGVLNLFPWLKFKLGQYRLAFDREWLTSEKNLPLFDRDNISRIFGLGRDIGLELSGTVLDDLFYWVGMYNGSGLNTANDNTDFLYSLRIAYEPFEKLNNKWTFIPYDHDFALSIGGGFAYNLVASTLPDSEETYNASVYNTTFDLLAYYRGLTIASAFYLKYRDPGAAGDDSIQYGYYIHLAYQVIPNWLEMLVRLSAIDPDIDMPTDQGRRYTGGLTFFCEKYYIKLQAFYSYYDGYFQSLPSSETKPALTGHEITLQAQIAF